MASGLRYGVEVRGAAPADAAELARLIGQPASDMAARLDAIAAAPAAVLVTTGYAGLNGVVALHWAPVLHLPRPLATINWLLVDPDDRRHGIGRLLLKAASQSARMAGCDVLELAAQDSVAAFCEATGFARQGAVFTRSLRKR